MTLASGVKLGIDPRASRIERALLLATEETTDHVWEPQTTRLLALLAADRSHVIVGGAYIGDQVVPLAHELRRRASACVVHAFEPMSWAFEALVRNVKRNALENVRCNRVGLWDERVTGLGLEGKPALASITAEAGTRTQTVDVTTIDAYCADHGIEDVGVVMLDLEGSEEAALRGSADLLGRGPADAPAVLFEVHREYVDWSDGLERTSIVGGLLDLGYTVLAVRDVHGNLPMADKPIELVPVDDLYLGGPPHGFNVLATKDRACVERLGLRIVPGVSPKLLPGGDPALHHPVGGF